MRRRAGKNEGRSSHSKSFVPSFVTRENCEKGEEEVRQLVVLRYDCAGSTRTLLLQATRSSQPVVSAADSDEVGCHAPWTKLCSLCSSSTARFTSAFSPNSILTTRSPAAFSSRPTIVPPTAYKATSPNENSLKYLLPLLPTAFVRGGNSERPRLDQHSQKGSTVGHKAGCRNAALTSWGG